jgi:hypothetical protein
MNHKRAILIIKIMFAVAAAINVTYDILFYVHGR